MRATYDDSPMWADTALSPEDVEAVVEDGGKVFARNTKALMHFLRRVLITIRSYQATIRHLDGEVQDLRMSRSRMGAPPTLSAAQMLQYMSPEQQIEAAGPALRAQYDRLERAERDAEAAKLGAQNERSRIRFELGRIGDDPEIGSVARERIAALLEQLGSPELPARTPGREEA